MEGHRANLHGSKWEDCMKRGMGIHGSNGQGSSKDG